MDKPEEFNPQAIFAAMYWHTYFATMGLTLIFIMYEIAKDQHKKQ